jgi:hypothetical protein
MDKQIRWYRQLIANVFLELCTQQQGMLESISDVCCRFQLRAGTRRQATCIHSWSWAIYFTTSFFVTLGSAKGVQRKGYNKLLKMKSTKGLA